MTVRNCAAALIAAVTLTACQSGDPAEPTADEIDQAATSAISDQTLNALRLPDGSRPGDVVGLGKSTLPAVDGRLPIDFDDAVRRDAIAAGEAFDHPVDDRVKDALRLAVFNALLRHGQLDPDDPAGIPAECVETDPETRQKRIIPSLHDGDVTNDTPEVQTAYNAWRSNAAPDWITTTVIEAFDSGVSSAREGD